MQRIRATLTLGAAAVLFLGCSDSLTDPARQSRFSTGTPNYESFATSGSAITYYTDSSGVFTVDASAQTLTWDGQRFALTQELANEWYYTLQSMRVAEEQVKLVRSGGTTGGELPLAPEEPPPNGGCADPTEVYCSQADGDYTRLVRRDYAMLRRNAVRVTRGGQIIFPPQGLQRSKPASGKDSWGTYSFSGTDAEYDLIVDPSAVCTELSQRIYEKHTEYRVAKDAVTYLLKAAGARAVAEAYNIPENKLPTKWLDRAIVYGWLPAFEPSMYAYARAQTELNVLATMFSANKCFTNDAEQPPTDGGGDGEETECVYRVYYNMDTGAVIRIVLLYCTPKS